jgi:hypothetical protein
MDLDSGREATSRRLNMATPAIAQTMPCAGLELPPVSDELK